MSDTDVRGGLRARLINDSLIAALLAGLDGQGWFDANRVHRPVRIITEDPSWDESVEDNLVVAVMRSTDTEYAETGSNLLHDLIAVTVDVYAESESLGVELSNDIKDLLRGRLGANFQRGTMPIIDFRQATPSALGYVVIDNVAVMRDIDQDAENWAARFYSIEVLLHDHYYPDGPVAVAAATLPGPALLPGPSLLPAA